MVVCIVCDEEFQSTFNTHPEKPICGLQCRKLKAKIDKEANTPEKEN